MTGAPADGFAPLAAPPPGTRPHEAIKHERNPVDIAGTAIALKGELREIVQRGETAKAMELLKNNRHLLDFQNQTSGRLWDWINQRKSALLAKRREYEQGPSIRVISSLAAKPAI